MTPSVSTSAACPLPMISDTIQQSLDQFESDAADVIPAKVHERYLWTNPETCNECYSRLRTIHEFERNDWGDVVEERRRSGAGVLGYDDDAGESSMHPATFCEECGGRGRAHDETDTKLTAVRRATRITKRLEEQDIPVDGVTLRRAARRLKEHDELQGLDREIYERATKLAVRRAQR